jgi:hypothetical protein
MSANHHTWKPPSQYWFVRDIYQKNWHEDLPDHDRTTCAGMAVQSLQSLRAKFSQARIWYMHMPWIDDDDEVHRYNGEWCAYEDVSNVTKPSAALFSDGLRHMTAVYNEKLPEAGYPPMHSYRRQAQLRATMLPAIAQAGFPSLDVSASTGFPDVHRLTTVAPSVRQSPAGYLAIEICRPTRLPASRISCAPDYGQHGSHLDLPL